MATAKSTQASGSPLGKFAAYTVAYTRPLVGLSMFFPPTAVLRAITSTQQADIPITFLSRLTGIREVALGGLLALALREQNKQQKHDVSNKEIRCVILANLLVDSVDLITASMGFLYGNEKERMATLNFGIGALVFVLLGLASLSGFTKNAGRVQL